MYPHRNPGMEIVLVEHGHLHWAVDQIPEVLSPGSVFFTMPWQAHGSLQMREPKNKIYFTLFPLISDHAKSKQLMPDFLQFSDAEQTLLSNRFAAATRHAWTASDCFRLLFPQCIDRLQGKSELEQSVGRSLLRSCLLELAGMIGQAPDAERFESPTVRKIHRFLQQLPSRLDHSWQLAEMAALCKVKRSHFSNICKQLTGYAPGHYLNRLRFETACHLLRETDRDITDIAFSCGYNSSQYFAENFKHFSRMSPSAYRRLAPELDAISYNNWQHPENRGIDDELSRAQKLKH